MQFKFTPRITSKDVKHVLSDRDVDKELSKLDIQSEEAHDLIKRIMIVTLRDGVWDINKIINGRDY